MVKIKKRFNRYLMLFLFSPNPVFIQDDVGVRLVGGRYPSEGRVEVLYGGRWTTVCGSSWDLNDAHVVCKQLNYTKAASVTHGASFGEGTGPIHMHDVQCVGNEKDVRDCPNRCGQAAWVNCNSSGLCSLRFRVDLNETSKKICLRKIV